MKKEKIVISDIWNCYSPYFKGKKEDINRLIKAAGISEECIANKMESGNIISFKYVDGNSQYVKADFVEDIVEKYPDVIVACMAEGDCDDISISVAVVISDHGCPFFTDGKIVGHNAGEENVTMKGFRDLFDEYHYNEKWVHPGSGGCMEISVDYAFPFYSIWDDETVFQNKPKKESKTTINATINYEDFDIKNGVMTGYNAYNDKVVIPGEIKKIGQRAFGYRSPKDITILSGVEEIGDDAFSDCNKLVKIIIPDSVTKIGDRAFKRCLIKKLAIPNSINTIGKDAFSECNNLQQIIIPENVTEIGEGAFANCDFLKEVKILGNITEIKDNTFGNCKSLYEIEIPKTVIRIGEDAFERTNLCKINITENVKEIGARAFNRCGLISISIPNAHIGEMAFSMCQRLTDVVISKGVDQLERGIFCYCHSLVNILLPESIYYIADDTFEGCENLTIRCIRGSYAEEYAKSHGIKYSIM